MARDQITQEDYLLFQKIAAEIKKITTRQVKNLMNIMMKITTGLRGSLSLKLLQKL